ncbi:hypothetical protein MNBD_UNCLBAC01-1391 [hydrothermal vent metagenome]|uniref:YrbA protein n=1 Tax=hydrothermal vent metagenome TaxID=652676 RepID=A0A3B1E4A1_9ZZZZ
MTLEEIKQIIEKGVPNSTAHVLDPRMDGQHLEALVISPVFEGMMLVKQHQMVMKALKEAFTTGVHAMGVKTFTQKKWDEVKTQYNI